MFVIRQNNKFFFFEDDAFDLCETNLLEFHAPTRFPIHVENALDEFVVNYGKYIDELYNPYQKLFTEGQLTTEKTGFKYAIWVDPAGENRNVGHNNPRLKIAFNGVRYTLIFAPEVKFVESEHPPKELKRELPNILKFIHKNKRVLLAYWYGKFKTPEGFESTIKSIY